MKNNKETIGWREWVALPDFNVKEIKAKIDTGARSSAIHASDIKVYTRNAKQHVQFTIWPLQHSHKNKVRVSALLLEYRSIKSSNGQKEERPVIMLNIGLMGQTWPIEVTLTNRDIMGFRMLLGRQAIREKFLVDAGRSFLSKKKKKVLKVKKKLLQ